MPKFSIILPVYNIDDKYKRAVESVINQDFEDFELIIVDDASPRKVEVSTFSDQRIRLITRKSNGGGPSLARNTALSIARGEYIAFLDADDYYAKNFLSEMNKHIVCGIDYVTCSFFLKNKEVEEPYRGGILSGVCEISDINDFVVRNLRNISASVWNSVYNAQIIKSLNLRFLDNREVFEEDLVFTFTYLAACKTCAFISTPLYLYELNDNSICANFRPNSAMELLRYMRCCNYLEEIFTNEVLAIFFFKSLDYCYRKGEIKLCEMFSILGTDKGMVQVLKKISCSSGIAIKEYWNIKGDFSPLVADLVLSRRYDEASDVLQKTLFMK